MAKGIAPFAEQHRMIVSMHCDSRAGDPNAIATPRSFDAALNMSTYFKVNLDIGGFTAANLDAVSYIRERHAGITHVHLKDRRKNQGANVPWGRMTRRSWTCCSSSNAKHGRSVPTSRSNMPIRRVRWMK